MRFGKVNTYLLLGGGVLLAEFAVQVKEAGYKVLVITSPRHIKQTSSENSKTLEQHLVDHGLEYIVSEKLQQRKILDRITPTTIGLSFGAAWIFQKKFIDKFDGQLLNLHGARLPQDRGAGGFSWQILRDNRLGCCLIHKVDQGIDSGPIIKYKEFIYPTWCRIPEDYRQVYIQENRIFLKDFLDDVSNKARFRYIEQVEYLSTYWPRLSTEHHGYVDWNWSLQQIERFICAFDSPYKGASTLINGRRVFLKKCLISFSDGVFHPFQKGMVYRKSGEVLFVATEEGTLVIGSVRDESGQNFMDKVRVGDRFFTPIALLEKAKQFRAIYTPRGLKQ